MLKEIFEQPARIRDTFTHGALRDNDFGESAPGIFPKVAAVQILACGTSYHAGLVARNWIESLATLPCQVEVARSIVIAIRWRYPIHWSWPSPIRRDGGHAGAGACRFRAGSLTAGYL